MKVLIVEDNETNRRVAAKATQSLGHEVATVENGLEAVHAVRKEHFAAILMDVQMPVMDGLEATRQILKEAGDHPPRIIGLTANTVIGDREACLDAGMADYLPKPLRIKALQEALALASPGVAATEPSDGIDRDQLESIVDPSDPESMEIFDDFQQLAREQLAQLLEARSQGDGGRVHQLAHQLKGSSGTFGFAAFAKAMGTLETAAKTTPQALPSAPSDAELLSALDTAIHAACQAIHT